MNYGVRTYVTFTQCDSEGEVIRRIAVECLDPADVRRCVELCRESVPGARYVRVNRSLRLGEGVGVLTFDEFVGTMV